MKKGPDLCRGPIGSPYGAICSPFRARAHHGHSDTAANANASFDAPRKFAKEFSEPKKKTAN